jgi:hypothetical protein
LRCDWKLVATIRGKAVDIRSRRYTVGGGWVGR